MVQHHSPAAADSVARVVATPLFKESGPAYAAHADVSPVNQHYDRATVLRLVGDLTGKNVVELGCAAGALTAQLLARGAREIIALDAEPSLLDIARGRIAAGARFEACDLEATPRPLAAVHSGWADVAVASLVLHYVKDWRPLLRDVRRCLTPAGTLVFSVHHPINGWLLSDRSDYHKTELVSETWHLGQTPVTATSYRRPLAEIFGSLRDSGFLIDVVDEPRLGDRNDIDPELLSQLNTQPFFLFVRARASD